MEFFALGHSIREGVKLENKVSKANELAATTESNNLVMKTNLADLNEKTLALAHQYDLSTNALAEANERLASIRPLKERIINLLNLIDPRIVVALNSGQAIFNCRLSASDFAVLRSLETEPGANKYILSVNVGGRGNTIVGPAGQILDVELSLSPELAR